MSEEDKIIKQFKAVNGLDIHKMSVRKLSEESVDNPLFKGLIWSKAYELEKELQKNKDALKLLNKAITIIEIISAQTPKGTLIKHEIDELLSEFDER